MPGSVRNSASHGPINQFNSWLSVLQTTIGFGWLAIIRLVKGSGLCRTYLLLFVFSIVFIAAGVSPGAESAEFSCVSAQEAVDSPMAIPRERELEALQRRAADTTINGGVYFFSERQMSLSGSHIKASDWLGKVGDAACGLREPCGDTLFEEEELFARLESDMKKSGKPLVLFVHGCCVSFSEGLRQAGGIKRALLEEGSGGPLLEYDWATPYGNYVGSLSRLASCRNRFNLFMDRLVARFGRGKIIVIAHSLGIHALQDYCVKRADDSSGTFPALVLSRPDIDSLSFKKRQGALARASDQLILLCAKNDLNINLSSLLRRAGIKFEHDPGKGTGSYQRLGQVSVARDFADAMKVYDVSGLGLSHLIPYKFIACLLSGHEKQFEIQVIGGVYRVRSHKT